MHFHLPKPLHGWREFVGEVGIVGPVGVPAAVGGESGAWDTAVQGQTLEHMPLEERLEFGRAFASSRRGEDGVVEEAQVSDQLGRLDHPEILETGGPQLRAAYAQALAWDSRNVFFSHWLLDHESLGERSDPLTLAKLETKESVRNLCRPLLAGERAL